MKTTKNVQKANLKSTVAATTLAIVFAVSNAFGFTAATGNSSLNAYLAGESEESLKMENWMTDASNFYAYVDLENETEATLDLAEWMTNESNFFNAISLEEEAEETMKLEDWMMDNKYWNGK